MPTGAATCGLVHFDANIQRSPTRQRQPRIERERRLRTAGEHLPPSAKATRAGTLSWRSTSGLHPVFSYLHFGQNELQFLNEISGRRQRVLSIGRRWPQISRLTAQRQPVRSAGHEALNGGENHAGMA
jgi:hypothetical protein